MEDSLVFFLVWTHAIHPAYLEHKQRCADRLHYMLCRLGIRTTEERHVCGMIKVLEYLSNSILIEYGYATPWYMRRDIDYYPLQVQGLDLAFPVHYNSHNNTRRSNMLGGYHI